MSERPREDKELRFENIVGRSAKRGKGSTRKRTSQAGRKYLLTCSWRSRLATLGWQQPGGPTIQKCLNVNVCGLLVGLRGWESQNNITCRECRNRPFDIRWLCRRGSPSTSRRELFEVSHPDALTNDRCRCDETVSVSRGDFDFDFGYRGLTMDTSTTLPSARG